MKRLGLVSALSSVIALTSAIAGCGITSQRDTVFALNNPGLVQPVATGQGLLDV